MDPMAAARFNIYWYLSLIATALIMLAATYWRRRAVLVLGILVSLYAAWSMCNLSVEEKWRIRNEVARTEAEMAYAAADGANTLFTAVFIGPFEAVIYTSFWGVAGWRLWPMFRGKERP